MKKDILLRSFLFVPAYNKRYIEKALICNADALILDIEDSVPPRYRQDAREILKEYFFGDRFHGRQVFIRINEIGTKDFAEDMTQLIFEGLT